MPIAGALRVLAPVDFSPEDEWALRCVERLASFGPVELTLLNVLEASALPTYELAAGDTWGAYMDEVTKDAELKMQRLATSPLLTHCSAVQVALRTEVVHSIAKEVMGYAQQQGFQLVLAVAKKHSRVKSLLGGTALRELLRSAQVPLLIFTPGQLPSFHRILYATDFSKESAEALGRAAKLRFFTDCALFCAKIHVHGDFETTRSFRTACREFEDELTEQDSETLGMVTDFISYHDEQLAAGILHCAEDHLADIILLATHGRKGLSKLLAGSVTEDVLDATALPVLVIKLREE